MRVGLTQALGAMTEIPAMQKHQAEAIAKLMEHFPVHADMTLQVLKGHLLIEETLREIFQHLLKSPSALAGEKGTSFTCHQIICLVEALAPKPRDEMKWVWSAAKQLNNLRNDMAHKLNPQGLESKIQSFLRCVREADPDIQARFDTSGAPPNLHFGMAISTLFGLLTQMRNHVGQPSQHGT